jgi:general secretion pathway protein D
MGTHFINTWLSCAPPNQWRRLLLISWLVQLALPVPALGATQIAETSTTAQPVSGNVTGCDTNRLRLHFRSAPLEQVLDYFASAAGYSVVMEARPRGKVDVWSDQPLSESEALNLLNSVLIKNELAAIRKGRTLTLINRDEAKTHDIPVRLGGDPDSIPATDEIVTQIIPVRFIEVSHLVKDLQPLVTVRTTMTANESANSIVLTDTQSNIHRIARIIQAIDSGAKSLTVVKVFRLKNADPLETEDLLASLFPDSDRSEQSQSPVAFPGPFPGLGGPGGGALDLMQNAQGATANSQRSRKGDKVVAVADARTTSVVVSAPQNLMDQIESILASLDANAARKQKLVVYQVKNASSQRVLKMLQDLFQSNGTTGSRTASTQTDPLETRSTQQSQQNQTGASTGLGGNYGGFGSPVAGGGSGAPQ